MKLTSAISADLRFAPDTCRKCPHISYGCVTKVSSNESKYEKYLEALFENFETNSQTIVVKGYMAPSSKTSHDSIYLNFLMIRKHPLSTQNTIEISWAENVSCNSWCHGYQTEMITNLLYKFMGKHGYKADRLNLKTLPINLGTEANPSTHVFTRDFTR